MLNHITGTDLTLDLDLKIGGEFVIADAGSLKLTVRGPNGTPIAGYDGTVLPDSAINHILVSVPAADNTLDPANDLELRYVELAFKSAGNSGVVKTTYRLIKFMPVQVGPQEVRNALGISFQEFPDAELDIFQSYIMLLSRPGFATALQSGTAAAIYANQILLYTEALRVAPSLRARILKQEEKDNALYIRFLMDFEALKADLIDALTAAENALDGLLDLSSATGAVFLVMTSPTDAVTGT